MQTCCLVTYCGFLGSELLQSCACFDWTFAGGRALVRRLRGVNIKAGFEGYVKSLSNKFLFTRLEWIWKAEKNWNVRRIVLQKFANSVSRNTDSFLSTRRQTKISKLLTHFVSLFTTSPFYCIFLFCLGLRITYFHMRRNSQTKY